MTGSDSGIDVSGGEAWEGGQADGGREHTSHSTKVERFYCFSFCDGKGQLGLGANVHAQQVLWEERTLGCRFIAVNGSGPERPEELLCTV